MTKDVLVVWPNRPDAMAQLEAAYTLHHLYKAEDPDRLVGEVADRVRAIVTTGEKGASADLMARLPNLEIVACFGVGVDAIDLAAAEARGVRVTNTPDVLTKEVADLGLCLTLAILRRVVEADGYVRDGRWAAEGPMALGRCATGKTMGILGMGRIGRALAARAEAIEMKVVYHNRRPRDDAPYPYFESPAALAEASDVLVLCCPGGEATRGIVDARVLEALGAKGYLVNIARGSVCDEPALVKALTEGTIAGAALDVFANEPHVPEPLTRLANVILLPHTASATNETRDAMAQLVVDNLAAHFAGKSLPTPVV